MPYSVLRRITRTVVGAALATLAFGQAEEVARPDAKVEQRLKTLGATVVARHAGEMINDISLAIGSGLGLGSLSRVVHPYPTQAAAVKMAADAYQRTRLTPTRKWLLKHWLSW